MVSLVFYRQVLLINLFLLFSLTQKHFFQFPISAATIRYLDPSLNYNTFFQQIGKPTLNQQGQNFGINVIILDGFKSNSNLQSLKNDWSPIGMWAEIFQKVYGFTSTKTGSTTFQIQTQIINEIHAAKAVLLFNAFSQEYNVEKNDYKQIIVNIADVIRVHKFDGVVIEWDSFSSVWDETADLWLFNFLQGLRNTISKQKIIAFRTYPTIIRKLTIFQNILINQYVDFYILKYYNILDQSFSTYQSIFINSSNIYPRISIKQLLQSQEIIMSLCKTIIEKPESIDGIWKNQTQQFVPALALNQYFFKAYNQIGWFGGYSNSNFKGQKSFQVQALSDLRGYCNKFSNCYC